MATKARAGAIGAAPTAEPADPHSIGDRIELWDNVLDRGCGEMADAQGLGPCGVTPVEVRVLSPAPGGQRIRTVLGEIGNSTARPNSGWITS
jgi:hypothetical protein